MEGSVTKAAKKMHLNQSTITLQIQTLERDLGMKLFERSKGKIILSTEGKMFYDFAMPHVRALDELFEKFIKYVKDKESNIITIAANHVSISYILPKYIKKFKTLNPKVKFKISNLQKGEALEKLMKDEVDIFIYPMLSDNISDELDFVPIVDYHPILLLRKDHPLVNKENITLSDLRDYDLIRIDSKFITLPLFEDRVKLHKLKTSIEFEISDWEILKKFVRADVGVAIISDICLEEESASDLIGKTLTNYFPKITYGILLRKGKRVGELLSGFITLLKTEKLLQAQSRQY